MSEITFSQILEALAVPFPSDYIEWKPQALSKDGKRALAAAYVDARHYQEKLDLVCPGWSSRIELTADGRVAKVAITIEGVTREDVGEASAEEANTVTTAVAQAFKRACAAFGLGRYLYFLPQQWCDYNAEHHKIVNPPPLPIWALPPAEQARELAERENEEALEKLRQQRANGNAQAQPETEPFDSGDPANTKVFFGKNKGKTLAQLWAEGEEGQGWIRWAAEKYEPRDERGRHLQRMAKAFLLAHVAYAG